MTDDPREPDQAPAIDTSVPHSARVWNYWLGGKDNYAVDRMAGDQVMAIAPDIVHLATDDRAFLRHAVTYLVGEAGIRQILDIGTGLPTAGNTHEVAQAIAPESRSRSSAQSWTRCRAVATWPSAMASAPTPRSARPHAA